MKEEKISKMLKKGGLKNILDKWIEKEFEKQRKHEQKDRK